MQIANNRGGWGITHRELLKVRVPSLVKVTWKNLAEPSFAVATHRPVHTDGDCTRAAWSYQFLLAHRATTLISHGRVQIPNEKRNAANDILYSMAATNPSAVVSKAFVNYH